MPAEVNDAASLSGGHLRRLVTARSSLCMKFMDVLQAGAGLVADSEPIKEYEETVNKAAALGRAIDLAEQAFL